MLEITNQQHFDAAKNEAIRLGLESALQEQLDYLASYACHGDPEATCCQLGWDFAPLSFRFSMFKKLPEGYKYWFNGGLIFHPGAGGVDRSLSVELDVRPEPHWSVHT